MSFPPPNIYSEAKLSHADAARYLTRIGLDDSLLSEQPSLEQLSRVLLAHLETVPKDTTPLHTKESDWYREDPKAPIVLRSNWGGMPMFQEAFKRIVDEHKGAYCFAVNSVFATLLRTLGYRVSELGSRAYKALGNDPTKHEAGWLWGSITHEVLVVDWEQSEGRRWVVDAMWGPWNLAKPIELKHKETILGLNRFEAYQLRHEPLPLSPGAARPIDSIDGWTLYRRITPVGVPITLPIADEDDEGGAYWSPLYHMQLISIPNLDFGLYNHYSASHPLGSFTSFWLITRLIPNTNGARLSMMYTEQTGDERKCAKVYITGGEEGQGSQEGREVRWVKMETGEMRAFLEKEFGYKFSVLSLLMLHLLGPLDLGARFEAEEKAPAIEERSPPRLFSEIFLTAHTGHVTGSAIDLIYEARYLEAGPNGADVRGAA